MENDRAIDATISIARREQSASNSQYDPSDFRGERAVLIAGGGIRTRRAASPDHLTGDETEPLLSHTVRDESETGAVETGDNEDDELPHWPGQADFEGLPWWKTPSVYWLLPAFLLYAMAFGGILVPKLNLIKALLCRDYFADQDKYHFVTPSTALQSFPRENEQCEISEIQSLVARFMLVGTLISGCLAALVSPALGSYSDRYGRSRLLAYTASSGVTSEVITILAANMPDTFDTRWLYLGFFMEGLSGSFIASMAISHSYASDCTPPARRNVAFGFFQACFFTGIALGPVVAGFVVKITGNLIIVFYISLGFNLFFSLFLFFIVPESLPKHRQLEARRKRALDLEIAKKQFFAAREQGSVLREAETYLEWIGAYFGASDALLFHLSRFNFFEPLRALRPTGPGTSPALRRNIFFLAAVDTIMFGVAMGTFSIIVYYVEYMFKWKTLESSIYVSSVNICRVTGLFVLLPALTRIVRGPSKGNRAQHQTGCDKLDINLIRLAVFVDTLGYCGFASAMDGRVFFASGIITALGGMGSPTLQSSLTKHVPYDQTGKILGATGMLHALARVLSPVVFNGIYSATVKNAPRTVFICLAVTFCSAFVLTWFIRPGIYLDEKARRVELERQATEERERAASNEVTEE